MIVRLFCFIRGQMKAVKQKYTILHSCNYCDWWWSVA